MTSAPPARLPRRARLRTALAVAVATLLVVACAPSAPDAPASAGRASTSTTPRPSRTPPPGTALMPAPDDPARPVAAPERENLRARTVSPAARRRSRALSQLTLEQRVRQLLMVSVPATDVATVGRLQAGGVIVLGDRDAPHLATREGTGALTSRLQQVAREATGLGLLVATDQEQGPVERIHGALATLPGGLPLGETGDEQLARRVAREVGDELAARGINLNLAPVADVNTNPDNPVIGDRAFGSEPELVARMVAAQIRGYRDAGIAATVKHFPGHGAAGDDSHVTAPVIDLPRERWMQVHLRPFRTAVEAGVAAVMTGHVVAPALDAQERPATLSPPVLTGLLRDRLGFDGVVITDALNMQAVRGDRSDAQVAVDAIAAGADVLLMPPDPDAAVHAVVEAVRSGRLSAEQVETAARRVLDLKARLGLLD